jgi:hypothetical protein
MQNLFLIATLCAILFPELSAGASSTALESPPVVVDMLERTDLSYASPATWSALPARPNHLNEKSPLPPLEPSDIHLRKWPIMLAADGGFGFFIWSTPMSAAEPEGGSPAGEVP